MKTTAPTHMATPTAIFGVRGSPNSTVPMSMAVRGSNTPRIDVFAQFPLFNLEGLVPACHPRGQYCRRQSVTEKQHHKHRNAAFQQRFCKKGVGPVRHSRNKASQESRQPSSFDIFFCHFTYIWGAKILLFVFPRCKKGVFLHRSPAKTGCQVQKGGVFAPESGEVLTHRSLRKIMYICKI